MGVFSDVIWMIGIRWRCYFVAGDVIWVREGGCSCYLGGWGWVMLFGWVGVAGGVIWVIRGWVGVDGDVVWVSGVSGGG